MRKLIAVSVMALLLVPSLAGATPVAKNKQEHELYGRVLLEPVNSVDYLQFKDEFIPAMNLMEKLYPRYLDFTTVADELNDKRALSLGPDGLPPWHKDDAKDGLPFHVVTLTDEQVPDKNKEYVFLTNAHASEPCGREGDLRFFEDVLIWRKTDPNHKLDAATGLTGKKRTVTVKELLERTKIYFVNTVPDGWSMGERSEGGTGYSNYNYGNFNSNRVAFHDGWVFSDDPSLYQNGYTTLTQPESAIVKYFEQVRRKELKGRAFAAAADMHGPLPVGAVLLHDQNVTPIRLERVEDLAHRITQKMEETLGEYITPQGAALYEQAMDLAGDARDVALKAFTEHVGPFEEKAAYITLEWAEYAAIWDHLDYTVTGTWGGWAASDAGLGADSISYEVDCDSFAPFNAAEHQLYVDNIRAIVETTVVHAATLGKAKPKKRGFGGPVGFYESGKRVTDADGNPSPPPAATRNPLYGKVEQRPYNVSNTDYFRDLRKLSTSPIVEVRNARLGNQLKRLDSFVVADSAVSDAEKLRGFAKSGGNLVLTDSALRMLPDIIDVPKDSIRKGYAYVGYSDLNREHPLTDGLYDRARQMFDPVGLGYPLLMERDQYWPCNTVTTECEKSPTKNSSPIWTVDRAAWEKAGGTTAGTADPPKDRKSGAEGSATDKTSIGILKLGKGRVTIFGALLPQPTERFDHWFGINPYTISIPGQTMLLRTLAGKP
jgi:hypothetical protein